MSVTETLGALGQWSVALKPGTPKAIWDKIIQFGHIVIDVGFPDAAFLDDGILTDARYMGRVDTISKSDTNPSLGGPGLLVWMGDSDDKGQVFESLLTITNKNFHDSVTAVLPTCVHAGTIFGTVPGTLSTSFQFVSPRTAMDYVTSTFGAEYRINNDMTLDAGLMSDLYRVQPQAAVVRNQAGVDMHLRALPGQFSTTSDIQDFTTRVLLLGQGDTGNNILDSTADISPARNIYKDFFGNPVKITRVVSESGTESGAASTRAQLALAPFEGTSDALSLSSTEYDIKGTVRVGDNIYVYDEDIGLVDPTQEIIFRGERMNPLTLRCTELTWPVTEGYIVAFRDGQGNWTDLTQYVDFEGAGQTTVVVGGYSRSLTQSGETIGTRPPVADASVPAQVVLTPPFTQAVYQSPINGETRAQVQVTWNEPLNTDGSVVLDGDHYEIWWRQASTPIFPSTWAQLAGRTWGTEATAPWGQPIQYVQGPWMTAVVGWDTISFLISELLPSHPYDIMVRAVDGANPPNFGAFSSVTAIQTSEDTIPPSVPAAPVCDASLIALQITHFLGSEAGGSFNLDRDLHHLEVHAQFEPTFDPSDETLLGKLIANWGMITGGIPAVGTFQVNGTEQLFVKVIAVDNAGNKSNPSTTAAATPDLIDDQHISDLTATKITAGTISVDLLLGGSIKTGTTGARTEIDVNGIRGYDASGNETLNQNNITGEVRMAAGNAVGQRVDIQPNADGIPRIDIVDDDAITHTTMTSFSSNYLQQRERNSDRSNDGGFMEWSTGVSFYGHRSNDGTMEHWFTFNESNDSLSLKGRWAQGTAVWGGESGSFVLNTTVAAGFGALSNAYGSTMQGGMNLNGNVLDTAGLNPNSITVSTTTSFTIAWTSARALFVFAQGWRIAP